CFFSNAIYKLIFDKNQRGGGGGGGVVPSSKPINPPLIGMSMTYVTWTLHIPKKNPCPNVSDTRTHRHLCRHSNGHFLLRS
ncbi:hypothetical protein GIB67_005363, partial [Kingdonia uniflora]